MKTAKNHCRALQAAHFFSCLILLVSGLVSVASAGDMTELSLEQLMQVEVTSAAKKPQKLSQTATAIYVITSEDIRRSGVTSIPEALRMAPGVQVAHVDHNKWAIAIRGFNSLYSNKLLVLMDGRTLYNTFFSGVWWGVQDTLMEDIDRIEVIRGPGAALWGANAVNGVINIITKHAQATQGLLLTAAAGSEEKIISGLRYGGSLGDKGDFRIYTKYFDQDEFVDEHGDDAWDDRDMLRCGFRADLTPADQHSFTIQGDYYDGNSGTQATAPKFTPPFSKTFTDSMEVSGGNLLARYNYRFANGSDLTLQTYYDLAKRDLFLGEINEETIDIDLQHHFSWTKFHNVLWGLGYRHIDHDVSSRVSLGDRKMGLFSGFLQDEISLIPERLKLILGARCEHNDFTGFEIQPSARLLWTPNRTTTVWAAVSRAVRTPHRRDHEAVFVISVTPPNPTNPKMTVVKCVGDDSFESEEVIAWETGLRLQFDKNLNFDLALFYNQYDDLCGAGKPRILKTSPKLTAMVVNPTNKYEATTYGAELLINWLPFNWWRLQFAGSCLDIDFDPDNEMEEKNNPKYQFSLRSLVDLPYDLEFDCWLRTVDELPSIDISSYTQLDLRLGWQPLENLELALIGRNLLDRQQAEFIDSKLYFDNSEVERSFYLKAILKF